MNIKELKELIKDLPNEMPVVVDGYERGINVGIRIVADFETLTYQITRMLKIDNSLNKPLNSAIIFTNC